MVTLTRSELAEMRARVLPAQETDFEARRRELKRLSDERVSHWPNTLEATRMKKQNWKLEREQALEAQRVQIDTCVTVTLLCVLQTSYKPRFLTMSARS